MTQGKREESLLSWGIEGGVKGVYGEGCQGVAIGRGVSGKIQISVTFQPLLNKEQVDYMTFIPREYC